MDKRFQVFVSSTYADLQEERQKVIQALMEMDCIPAGMVLAPFTVGDVYASLGKKGAYAPFGAQRRSRALLWL